MMNRYKRAGALVLSLIVLLGVCSVFGVLPAAAETPTASRFIFEGLQGAGGTPYTIEQDQLALPLSGEQADFTALALKPLGENGSTNTLCVSLINASNATLLRVTYQYTDYQTATETVEQILLQNTDDVQTFYLNAPHISAAATSLSVSFLGEAPLSGSVALTAFTDISMYASGNSQGSSTEPWTTDLSCKYDPVTGSIGISGQLNHVALARYGGEVLALFALDPAEEIYLSNKTPVARIELSSQFSFTVPASSAHTLFSRYVVAAVTARGERVPLSTPVYPAISIAQSAGETGFKGFHTDDLGTALNVGATMEIVDVYLDRLHGNQSTGILYVGDEAYYYFDDRYVSELDARIRRLAGAGCSVYLRFLVSPDANDLPYVALTQNDQGIVNKGIVIQNTAALNNVYALTDFLTERYADSTIGKISGIILGRRVDHATRFNNVGATDLASYTELYASLLQVVAGTARRNIGNIDVVVPLSDRIFTGAVGQDDLFGNYYPELFLRSLLCALKDATQMPPSFRLMIESDTTPARLAAQEETHYGIDSLALLQAMLRQYSAQYPFISGHIIYSWTPDTSLSADRLVAAYVWQYIKLYFDGQVNSFIVDFSLLDADEAKAPAEILSYIVQNIDTAATETVTTPSLALLGVTSQTEIAQAYTALAMANRKLIREALRTDSYSTETTLKGSYTYWNFGTAVSTLGWYDCTLCRDLSVTSGIGGRALRAHCLPGSLGSYTEIACHFSARKDISYAPFIKLRLGISGAAGASYEVQVRLVGKGVSVIASAVIQSGEAGWLYLDLSDFTADLSGINAIRVLSRPLDGNTEEYSLDLYSVAFESETLTDAELALHMASVSGSGDDNAPQKNFKELATAIIITFIVVSASVALIVIFVVRQYKKVARDSRTKRVEKG